MSTPTILIVSSEEDSHIPFVTRHLPEESFIIIDPAKFVDKTLSYNFVHGVVEVSYNGLTLKRIQSVWYRKPIFPEKEELPVPTEFHNYVSSAQRQHFLELLGQFSHAFWISDYYSLQKSGDKMTQLMLAKKLGFKTPVTLLTADPAAAKQFLDEHGTCIVKPASRYGLTVQRDGVEHKTLFYATKIRKRQKVDLTNLELAPSFFQQAIDPVADIRVNVVGGDDFATAITYSGQKPGTNGRDWRIGHTTGEMEFTPHRLPRAVARRCIAFIRSCNLQFGAFDLILDKQGDYWFIECNPNGQWAFVEEMTEQPIGKAIANLLMRAYRSPQPNLVWFS